MKDFQIIIDSPKDSELAFYVINDDVGLNPEKLIKDNLVRKHLNPSRAFTFNIDSIKVFTELLQNEVTFLHKRSQELYSAIKNVRPLLSPFVVSPYLYSSGLAKKVRYYNEICHLKDIQYDPNDIQGTSSDLIQINLETRENGTNELISISIHGLSSIKKYVFDTGAETFDISPTMEKYFKKLK